MIQLPETRNQKFSELFGFAPAVSWRLLTGKRPTWQDVIEQLKRYDLRVLLNRIMCLSIECRDNGSDQETQKRLLVGLLGQGQAEAILEKAFRNLVQKGDTKILRFFFELQLINAARIALLYCDTQYHDHHPNDLKALANALLMITDLLDLPDESERTDESMGRFLRVNLLAQYQGKLAHRLARAHLLHTGSGMGGQLDSFSERLSELTKLSPDLVMTAGLTVWSMMRSFSKEDIVKGDVFISKDGLFRNFRFSKEEIDKMWDLSCVSAARMKAELRKTWKDENPNPFNLLPFQKWPLIELENNVYCPSIQLLFTRFAEGLHHFQLSDSQEDNWDYLRILGYKFEQYVDNLICTVRGGHGAVAGYNRDQIGDATNQIVKYGDGVIAYGNEAILIEVKSGFLDHIAASKGDSEKFEKFFNDKIVEGAEQLGKLLERAEAGQLRDIGVEPNSFNRYYPILILQQPFFEVTLYERLQSALKEKGILENVKAAPIQVIDIGAFEYLIGEAERGTDILTIIKGKALHPTWHNLEMTRYLYSQYGELKYCEYLEKKYDSIFSKILDQLDERR